MNRALALAVVMLATLLTFGCSDNSTSVPADGATTTDTGPGQDTGVTPDGGVAEDTGGGGGDDEAPIDGGVVRHYTYRAISGVSMGASAATFLGSRHPEMFDAIGSLGGYINLSYMLHMIKFRKMSGFCPMQQILDNLADINDPNKNPNIFCGPVKADITYPFNGQELLYEHTEDYNHWFYFDSGGEFDRDDHIQIFGDLAMGMGNPGSYNPDVPFLPAGITRDQFLAWKADPDKCKPDHTIVIDTPPYNCNREYNPDCTYPLIMYCDGEEPVGCYVDADHPNGDPTKCGKNNPDYSKLKGVYDPYYAGGHNNPMIVMVAVDYNKNGMRDYGEPVIANMSERFDDTGVDGCFDAIEDGKGGCCKDADFAAGTCSRPYDPATNPDPNHDNFHWLNNPTGTEGNWLYDEGEPFDDFGLDGVKADAAKGIPADYGEGNGKFDYSPNLQRFLEHDIVYNLRNVLKKDPAALDRLDIYIDGGIRDIFNSAVHSINSIGPLGAMGMSFKRYDDFWGYQTSLLPDVKKENDFLTELTKLDMSVQNMGKNVMLLYGKPDATQKLIDSGDGAHVGTTPQAIDRHIVWFLFAGNRWPHGDRKPSNDSLAGLSADKWFHSTSMSAYRRYHVTLPPGYNAAENASKRYPVVYFMHGYGMTPGDMGSAGVIFQGYMASGDMAKVITVFPDGQCCFINHDTGVRECACKDDPDPAKGDQLLCVDDQGNERDVPKSTLPEHECNRGSFYLDMVSDLYADTDFAAQKMKYEGSIMDLIDYIDQTYRTKAPADVVVKK